MDTTHFVTDSGGLIEVRNQLDQAKAWLCEPERTNWDRFEKAIRVMAAALRKAQTAPASERALLYSAHGG